MENFTTMLESHFDIFIIFRLPQPTRRSNDYNNK